MFHFLLSLTIVLLFTLIVYIFVSDYRKNSNLYFVILFMVTLFFFLNRLFYVSTENIIYMNSYIVALITLPAVFLWLSTKYPMKRELIDINGYEDIFYFIAPILLIIVFFYSTGNLFKLLLSGYYLVYIGLVIYNFAKSINCINDFKSEKVAFVVGGIILFFVLGLGSLVFFSDFVDVDFKIDSVSAIIMVLFVIFGALRYDLFDPEPKSEGGVLKIDKKSNRCFIAKNQKHGVKILVNKVKNQPGIGFVRTNPKLITQEHKLTNTILYWISEGNEMDKVNPTDLEKILFISKKFFGRSSNGVILLDCLEYLLTFNEFNAVYQFLQQLKDDAYILEGEIILPLNKGAFDKDKFNLLISDFEEI